MKCKSLMIDTSNDQNGIEVECRVKLQVYKAQYTSLIRNCAKYNLNTKEITTVFHEHCSISIILK